MDILIVILALYGLGMVVWLMVSGARSATDSAKGNMGESRSIELPESISDNGWCMARNARYQARQFNKYSVDVLCPTLGRERHLTAPTYEQLLKEIEKAYAKLESEMNG